MSILNTAVLTVTPDGEFIWNENADEMIKNGDFSESPAMPHILRRLRQRDELLEALKTTHGMLQAALFIINDPEARAIAKEQLDANRAAINKAEGKA